MAILLTESLGQLLSETTAQHLLIEPIAAAAGFPSRFSGAAVIYKMGDFWEMDCGRGTIKSERLDRLEEMARRLGAIRIEHRY